MSPIVFIGSLVGVLLIVVPLWDTIMRPFRRLNMWLGRWLCAVLYAQPFSNLMLLERVRDNKVRTFRVLIGARSWALVLIHERPKDDA